MMSSLSTILNCFGHVSSPMVSISIILRSWSWRRCSSKWIISFLLCLKFFLFLFFCLSKRLWLNFSSYWNISWFVWSSNFNSCCWFFSFTIFFRFRLFLSIKSSSFCHLFINNFLSYFFSFSFFLISFLFNSSVQFPHFICIFDWFNISISLSLFFSLCFLSLFRIVWHFILFWFQSIFFFVFLHLFICILFILTLCFFNFLIVNSLFHFLFHTGFKFFCIFLSICNLLSFFWCRSLFFLLLLLFLFFLFFFRFSLCILLWWCLSFFLSWRFSFSFLFIFTLSLGFFLGIVTNLYVLWVMMMMLVMVVLH